MPDTRGPTAQWWRHWVTLAGCRHTLRLNNESHNEIVVHVLSPELFFMFYHPKPCLDLRQTSDSSTAHKQSKSGWTAKLAREKTPRLTGDSWPTKPVTRYSAPEQKETDPEDAGGGRAVAYAEGDNLDHACALIVAVAADIIPCWRWSGSRPWRPRSVDTHCFYTHCLYAWHASRALLVHYSSCRAHGYISD